jgi:hypothetical protein
MKTRSTPRSPVSKQPTAGPMLDESLPLIGVIPVAGPAAILVAGPWLLFALMLAGPFALLVTLSAVLVAVAALIGLIGAILAAPYLLVRYLHSARARHSTSRALVQPLPANPPAVAHPALLPESVSATGYQMSSLAPGLVSLAAFAPDAGEVLRPVDALPAGRHGRRIDLEAARLPSAA